MIAISALVAAAVAIGITLGSATHAPASPRSGNQTSGPFVVRGNGLGSADFGQPERVAVAALESLLGPARSSRPIALPGNCTVDAALQWSTLTAYFFHGKFDGYATASLLGAPANKNLPDATTQRRLRIGDTLARAVQLYHRSLTTSYAQGGSWTVVTPDGRLAGYLTSEVGSTHPPPRIADFTAGSVGCPAASP